MSTEDLPIPKTSFYGKKHLSDKTRFQVKIQRIEETVQNFSKKPLPVKWKMGLMGPTDVWKVFRKQNEALQFAKKFGKGVMVFSHEEKIPGNKGQRLYLVTNPRHMWKQHLALKPEERCSYEVITEGAVCKLYFDLEFLKEFNPNHDGDQMIDIFIKCILWFLEFLYGIVGSRENILDLEASTTVKFSRHLIFQFKNCIFKDNIQAGYFVRTLCIIIRCCITSISSEFPTEDPPNFVLDGVKYLGQKVTVNELEKLMILDKNSKRTLFCDEGVYSRNRNFRLYLSTKFGQNAPLKLSLQNKFLPTPRSPEAQGVDKCTNDAQELLFLSSLITYTSFAENLRVLECKFESQEKLLMNSNKASLCSDSVSGINSSPYPELDSFIQEKITCDVNGYIRQWSYFPQSELLVYVIANYRYCDNIKRHHRSNNIMFLVNIDRRTYYQKCYDPECRKKDFKSEELPLPSNILPWNSWSSDWCNNETDGYFEVRRNPLDETSDDEELSTFVAAVEMENGFAI